MSAYIEGRLRDISREPPVNLCPDYILLGSALGANDIGIMDHFLCRNISCRAIETPFVIPRSCFVPSRGAF